MSEFKKAPEIIDALKQQARAILTSQLASKTLDDFDIGALGNFPYTWKDPYNTQFNAKTYNWIKSALKAKSIPATQEPATQEGVFTNEYINALSKVMYSYSTKDQETVNKNQAEAVQQQGALLEAWKNAGFPLEGNQPINGVLTEIQTKWAKSPTTLYDIQNSSNLSRLLSNTPPSGQVILPLLANYLRALGASVTLVNNSTMNTGYLADALDAAQNATTENGGVALNDGTTAPAYPVATAMADILNGLKATENKATLSMDVSNASSSEFAVKVSGGAGFSIPFGDFFTLDPGGHASFFHDTVVTSSNEVTVNMEFTGLTLVSYGPAEFDSSQKKNWYWMTPIIDAIKNGDSDVSGFKFSPDPQIDFSKAGPFGFTTNVAISNYPSVTIVVTGEDLKEVENKLSQSTSCKLTFLGIPLASASESTYASSVKVDKSSSTVTITLTPPPSLNAGDEVDAVGWVLGAATSYPAA